MTISQTLRAALANHSLSLADIAQQTGMNLTTLQSFAKGKAALRIENLECLVEFLGLTLQHDEELEKQQDGLRRQQRRWKDRHLLAWIRSHQQ